MSLKNKLIAGLVTAALLLGLVKYCDRPVITPTEPGTLAPGEKTRIEFTGRTVTRIDRDKTTREYVPDRNATVSLGDDGKLTLKFRKHGFTREPGIGVALTGDKLKLEADLKLYFFHRLGLHLGATFDPGVKQPLKNLGDFVKLAPLATYTLPVWDNRLSVGAGAELFPQRYIGVLRVAF